MQNCPKCKRPLLSINVCAHCYEKVDPIKTEYLIAIVAIIFILGILVGKI